MNIKNIYIGNKENWAINGIKRGFSNFLPSFYTFIVSIPLEPISDGWKNTLEKLIYRVEKISDFIRNEESIGVTVQVGLLEVPCFRFPVIGAISGITLGKNDITIGLSLSVSLPILNKNELFTVQLASMAARDPVTEDPLDDVILNITKGHISLTDIVEESIKKAYISLKMSNFIPKTSLIYFKENLYNLNF